MITMFVREWLKLVTYCNDTNNFDAGIFAAHHDNYQKAWSKLSVEDQGSISDRLSLHKETI